MEPEYKTLGELFGIPDAGKRFVRVDLGHGNWCEVDTEWKVRIREPKPEHTPQSQTDTPEQSQPTTKTSSL